MNHLLTNPFVLISICLLITCHCLTITSNNNIPGGLPRTLSTNTVYHQRAHTQYNRLKPESFFVPNDLDDDDLFDLSKRLPTASDDYGHFRFGKRDPVFDDYGHMRFGRGGAD
ncbi:hypothetical protein ABEB36_011865 [Hypothenemus hampei]|uniref:Sulfakinin n=1 Tax=Hypothenemus hampei TaxID=57062 RepID=A0ABD1E9J2_HYPHA